MIPKGLFCGCDMEKQKDKLIFGVGVMDSEYKVCITKTIDGKSRRVWICPIYRIWKDMLTRCYSPAYKARWPTYVECKVANEWHIFSSFRNWALTKNWAGNELDKDLICPLNKVYSSDYCVFISQALNTFLVGNDASRGEWPIGVHWSKRDKKFIGLCRNPFTRKQDHLGSFDCPHAAHEAWRQRKHQHALSYAEMQDDPRIAEALRTRYLPGKEII